MPDSKELLEVVADAINTARRNEERVSIDLEAAEAIAAALAQRTTTAPTAGPMPVPMVIRHLTRSTSVYKTVVEDALKLIEGAMVESPEAMESYLEVQDHVPSCSTRTRWAACPRSCAAARSCSATRSRRPTAPRRAHEAGHGHVRGPDRRRRFRGVLHDASHAGRRARVRDLAGVAVAGYRRCRRAVHDPAPAPGPGASGLVHGRGVVGVHDRQRGHGRRERDRRPSRPAGRGHARGGPDRRHACVALWSSTDARPRTSGGTCSRLWPRSRPPRTPARTRPARAAPRSRRGPWSSGWYGATVRT
jgi:hypothetical protein